MIPWNRLPYEVQLLIVVEAVNTPSTLSPASAFLDILLLSHDVYDALLGAPERGLPLHNDIYSLLFESRFDSAAPKRRLLSRGGVLTPDNFAAVFKERCVLLGDIKSGEGLQRFCTPLLNRETLERALWGVYLMLLEDDGKNMEQLEHAGVEHWLIEIMLFFVKRDVDVNGWVNETIFLQLAVASFAIVSDRQSVINEGLVVNRQINEALEPILFGCHRYPHAHIPITYLYADHIEELTFNYPLDSLRGLEDMPISAPNQLIHFGRRVMLSPPLLAPNVALIVTNRNELRDTVHLPNIPANRAEADARDFGGATAADYALMNYFRRLAIGVSVPRAGRDNENWAGLDDPITGSKRWDILFNRMRGVAYILTHLDRPLIGTWFDTMYKPGMLTGSWLGRLIFPDWRILHRMYDMHPASFSDVRDSLEDHELGVYFNAISAHFREHISTDLHSGPAGCGEEDSGNGVKNGYFPSSIDPSVGRGMHEDGTKVVVRDPWEPEPELVRKHYGTWRPGMELPKALPPPPLPLHPLPEDVEMNFDDEGLGSDQPYIDVIITGETDYGNGKAWGAYTFYGRVRKLDGLIVLVRPPQNLDPNSGQGRWIFSGYIHMANTIVGNWREATTDVRFPGLQAPFIMSKVGPGFSPPV